MGVYVGYASVEAHVTCQVCGVKLTGVVLLVQTPLVVLLPAPAGLAVVAHLLQQVQHSDLPPPSLVVRLTVDNVVQRRRRSGPSLLTAAGVAWATTQVTTSSD